MAIRYSDILAQRKEPDHAAQRATVLHADQAKKKPRKRKLSEKQLRVLARGRRLRMKSLRAAKRKKAKPLTKRAGRASLRKRDARRQTTRRGQPRRKTRMARRRKKTSAKQRAAARRNIKKAQRARRRNLRKPRSRQRRHRVRGFSYTRPRRRVRVKSHLSYEEARKPRRRRRRRHYAKAAEAPRRRRRRRSYARAAEAPRRRRRRRSRRRARRNPGRAGRRSRRGAMENPLSGTELFVGAISGGVGFIIAKFSDIAIATRDSAVVKSVATPIYKDVYRMGAGILLTAVPLVGAYFIRSPLWRSGVQFVGVASLLYFVTKLVTDVGAMLLHDSTNDTVKKLFGPEIAAQDMLAAAEKKTGGGALPQGAGAPRKDPTIPSPPAFTGGQPSPAAMAAVRANAPALRALGAVRADLLAMHESRATPEQVARVDQVKRDHKVALGELGKFHPAELEAAVGLAGISAIADVMKPRGGGAPPVRPQNNVHELHAQAEGKSHLAWANNG